ncbi:MAG TPA: fumarylacetoacetate hydrolase family protein [Verrucomicrobiae bacterium]|nr:fumarylacetoacetate hydrolase family protein [Verrucomicrobiae bacterium]
MKLYTFIADGPPRLGVAIKDQIIDLAAAAAAMRPPRHLPADMLGFLQMGEASLIPAREALAFMQKRPALPVGVQVSHLFETVKLLAPIPRPGKILCSGINYRGHMEENPGAKLPTEPFFFSKLPSAVIGPGEPIIHPKLSRQVDYEVEFAVVIGKRMKRTPRNEVLDCVAGYTILHDVSARDVQFKDNQITLGKNFDSFCPIGPCIVTKDELPDPGNVRLRSFLNGKVMQDGTTADWVFPLPELLGRLSDIMSLEPGDVISTGTPAGVGVFRKPQVFLKAGDLVRLEIDGIGALENPVVAD